MSSSACRDDHSAAEIVTASRISENLNDAATQPHRLYGLIDHQLLHHQLIGWNGGYASRESFNLVIELVLDLSTSPSFSASSPLTLSPVNSILFARSGSRR